MGIIELLIALIVALVTFVETVLFRALNSRGTKLQKAGRHREAYKAFALTLKLIPPWRSQLRTAVMSQLGVCALRSRQYARSLQWSRAVIARNPPLVLLLSSHSLAATALSSMGRLDEAATHLYSKRDIALRSGDSASAADASGQLASILDLQGKFEDALKISADALADHGADRRKLLIAASSALSGLGRFQEARDVLVRARAAEPYKYENPERHSQAVLALYLAWAESDMQKGDAAWQYLQEARPVLETDEQYAAMYAATVCWVLAVRRRTQEAMEAINRFEAQATMTGQDGAQVAKAEEAAKNLSRNNKYLGLATFALRDYRKSRDYWAQRVNQKLQPCERPIAYYFLGECLARIGDVEAAKQSFQRCLELNIPGYYSGLAAARLQDIGAPA